LKMSTIKFDTIAEEFMHRVNDEFLTSFTPGGGVMPGGSIIRDADDIASFVNRAMQKLFNDQFVGVKGDLFLFEKAMPELIKKSAALTLSSGVYTVASPHLDIFQAINGKSAAGNYIRRWSADKWNLAETGHHFAYVATSTNPALIHLKNEIYFYPNDLSGSPTVVYIQKPVDPTTGNFYTQNGSYDSPFHEHWNSVIAEIAYQLYLQESGETA